MAGRPLWWGMASTLCQRFRHDHKFRFKTSHRKTKGEKDPGTSLYPRHRPLTLCIAVFNSLSSCYLIVLLAYNEAASPYPLCPACIFKLFHGIWSYRCFLVISVFIGGSRAEWWIVIGEFISNLFSYSLGNNVLIFLAKR